MSQGATDGPDENREAPREPTPGSTRVLQWLGMMAAIALAIGGLWLLVR
jgi:hypothetical protein